MVEPTRAQWQALYEVAVAFRDLAPWRWLEEEDLFAVEDPSTGEVGYCDVLGMGGQEFGLAVFLGSEGFAAYRQLMLGEVEPEGMETLVLLRSLSVTFVDREFLERRDRAVIRSLALRFRGRNAWPWFRSQQPGYLPWYLEQEEAVFLAHALEQAVEVTQRVGTGDLDLTTGLEGEPVLTRCYRDGTWKDEWQRPPRSDMPAEEPTSIDEVRLQRLRAAKPRGRDTWLLDFFVLPAPIGARDERPYLPRMLLVATQQGVVLGTELLEPWASAQERLEALLTLLEQAPALPRAIRVGRSEAQRLVTPVAHALGIPTRMAELSLLDGLKAELLDYLSGR